MAAIIDIKIMKGEALLAEAGRGEVGVPGEPYLTIDNAVWNIDVRSATDYLQQQVKVTGIAAQRPFNGTLRLTGLSGKKFEKIKLSQ